MENWNLILSAIGTTVAVCGAFGGLAIWFVKVQLEGLKVQLNTMQRELHEYKEQISKIEERQRNHTGDSEKHLSATWRIELNERLVRIEDKLDRLSTSR